MGDTDELNAGNALNEIEIIANAGLPGGNYLIKTYKITVRVYSKGGLELNIPELLKGETPIFTYNGGSIDMGGAVITNGSAAYIRENKLFLYKHDGTEFDPGFAPPVFGGSLEFTMTFLGKSLG